VVHLIDVLLGKNTPKIQQFSHQSLSTFGIGKGLSQSQWSSVYRQLVAGGYLESDIEAYGGLKLAEPARPVLKGETSVWLRRDIEVDTRRASRTQSKGERTSRAKEGYEAVADDPLWHALKAKRLELAREQGVPPYVIFHDSTLLEMLDRKPETLTEMGDITGIGQAKLERYGDEFLEVLEEYAWQTTTKPPLNSAKKCAFGLKNSANNCPVKRVPIGLQGSRINE
jgi:ATP-dependent DNA helicase RecQ